MLVRCTAPSPPCGRSSMRHRRTGQSLRHGLNMPSWQSFIRTGGPGRKSRSSGSWCTSVIEWHSANCLCSQKPSLLSYLAGRFARYGGNPGLLTQELHKDDDADWIRRKSAECRSLLYRMMSDPLTHSAAGIIFESMFHKLI